MAGIRFFSLLFLAMAMATLLANHATAAATGDLCAAASYKGLCRAAVKGITDPKAATISAINYAIAKTKNSKVLAMRLGKTGAFKDCTEMYQNSIEDLQDSLQSLKERDVGTLSVRLSGAISWYSSCEDAFVESGKTSPLVRVSNVLSHMVDNCLALVPSMQL